jgi:hypothetical protein
MSVGRVAFGSSVSRWADESGGDWASLRCSQCRRETCRAEVRQVVKETVDGSVELDVIVIVIASVCPYRELSSSSRSSSRGAGWALVELFSQRSTPLCIIQSERTRIDTVPSTAPSIHRPSAQAITVCECRPPLSASPPACQPAGQRLIASDPC